MKTTGNLGLKKPDGTDIVDITDLNGNMDTLDTAVKAVQDHAVDGVKHITAAERTAWNAKASTAAATTSAAGLMAAADKAKLDGVAAGANNYVHPNHTGDVTSTGDGVTAIAPGVIVNADINAAAAIDATKIGTGAVSNAEFGYLDGVTSGIQGQLDTKSGIVDYVRQPAYATTAGTSTVYTATLTPAPASLTEGFGITIVPHVTNGASPTLNVNGLGAIALKDQKGAAYAAGKLLVGKPYMFRKVGTDFLADSAGGSGNAVAGDIRAGKTAATDAGDVTGTLTVQTGGTVTPGPSAIVKAAGIYDTAITVAGVTVPAANVLAGTTIAGTAGTMPNKTRAAVGGYTTAVSALGDSGGSLVMEPPTGYYEAGKNAGNFGTLIATDANFVPGNILGGKSIFGVAGSIPNRSVENNHMPSLEYTAWVGDRVFLRPPAGYYNGATWVTAPAGNVRSENIRAGYDILGVTGTMREESNLNLGNGFNPDGFVPMDYDPGTGYIYMLSTNAYPKVGRIYDQWGNLLQVIVNGSGLDIMAITRYGYLMPNSSNMASCLMYNFSGTFLRDFTTSHASLIRERYMSLGNDRLVHLSPSPEGYYYPVWAMSNFAGTVIAYAFTSQTQDGGNLVLLLNRKGNFVVTRSLYYDQSNMYKIESVHRLAPGGTVTTFYFGQYNNSTHALRALAQMDTVNW